MNNDNVVKVPPDSEVWLPIPGYNDIYEICTLGLVRSVDRERQCSNGVTRKYAGKILAIKRTQDGYPFVTLCNKNGTCKTHYVHRLVARAFIPNPNNFREVNHKSGNKEDNSTANLEWINHRCNVKHAYDVNLNKNKGGNHSFAVGVVDNTLGQRFDTIKDWCATRGIKYSTGRNILSGCNKPKIDKRTLIISLNNTDNGREYEVKQ